MFKLKRGPIRAAFTKAVSELKLNFREGERDLEQIQLMFARVDRHFKKLSSLDDAIENELLAKDGVTEEEFANEYETVAKYHDEFEAVQLKVQSLQAPESAKTEGGSCVCGTKCQSTKNYKLPVLEFKKYDGNPRGWLAFWSQFKSIHDDEALSPEIKFQYLIQATTENSRARQVVDSFPISADNYPKAIDYLISRFGRPGILIEVYVRDLLGLVLDAKEHGCHSLSLLYDRLESQLRALDSLGVTQDKYGAMLYPLVESSLPEELLRTYQRSRVRREGEDQLKSLMTFFRAEVEGEERVRLAQSGFATGNAAAKHVIHERKKKEVPTANDLYVGSNSTNRDKICIFCKGRHSSAICDQAKNMSLDEKKNRLREDKACFACFQRFHVARKCRAWIQCDICRRRHLRILCPELPEHKIKRQTVTKTCEENGSAAQTVLTTKCSGDIYLQTLVVQLIGEEDEIKVRALIDTGSQRSYITREIAKRLKLKSAGSVELSHRLFGGVTTGTQRHDKYSVTVSSLEKNFSCKINAIDQPVICENVKRIGLGPWTEELMTAGIQVSDVGKEWPQIHLLIGADVAGQLFTGDLFRTQSGPVAMNTKLGWTLMGRVIQEENTSDVSVLSSLFTSTPSIEALWQLDVLGIRDTCEVMKEEERMDAVLKHFKETIAVNEDGRYEVALPWRQPNPPVANNLEISRSRLFDVTRKLVKNGKYNAYERVFSEWESLGIIEEISREEWESSNVSYIPHRPVYKPSSLTTPIRPVFDASAKSENKFSINELLESGPNLIELIPAIITRFRLRRIGIISDIQKAFLQISLRKEDRDFLRFLWWEENMKTLKIFRHCRVVFGVTSSPFHLIATVNHHLNSFPCTRTVNKLKQGFYTDNCVISVDSEDDAKVFIEEATEIMLKGKFELRGWTSNQLKKSGGMSDGPASVLGLKWNLITDKLSVDIPLLGAIGEKKITKRLILSVAQRIFDPIGVTVPVTLVPKLLLREVWLMKLSWDEEVPGELSKRFLNWALTMSFLEELSIPRWVLVAPVEHCALSLHLFADASKVAYAACVFIRCVYKDKVSVHLLQARSRIAPVKTTIPRMELLACSIGARLLNNVKGYLGIENIRCYQWTDSSNALYWIRNNESWLPFVYNRVQEIRKLTLKDNWRHIPGAENPADLPSRGCDAKSLLQSSWWEGPLWLKSSEERWPKSEVNGDMAVILAEKKRINAVNVATMEEPWYLKKFSSYRKIVRLVAWLLRWRFRGKGDLRSDEIDRAEKILWRIVQKESFSNSVSLYQQLHARPDELGLRRVRSKLVHRKDSEEFKFPILLPSNHKLVELLIIHEHVKLNHAGVNVLMSQLREKYWILQTRRTIKRVLNTCVLCKRFHAKRMEVEEAPLPADRVRDVGPFEVIGVDLGGPLYLKGRQKVWFAVFTCAVYRAVYLDLITSLSTQDFLKCFRRFIARCGRPCVVFSDNATNFKGLARLLKGIDWQEIQDSTVCEGITWKFSAPNAPWWGGFWERMVGLVKDLLRKNLKRACLSYEDLITLLVDIEGVINSRPLTYVSEDPNDLIPLTPALFTRGYKSAGTPDIDYLEDHNLVQKHSELRKLRENLRKRFRSEYLGSLSSINKKTTQRELVVGELVFIGSDNVKRSFWPVGVVEELIPGRDGKIRTVKLRTASGVLIRAVQRLFPLELH